MKISIPIFFLFLFFGCSKPPARTTIPEIPAYFQGNFEDDYGINYKINNTIWTQGNYAKYHILKWDAVNQFLIVRNADSNPSDAGLYSRIDYILFQNMDPYTWGYCLSFFTAETQAIAEDSGRVDRLNPKTGCNGYPFSRMKRATQ